MYEVDDRDRVVRLEDVPQSSPGSPVPLVLADEHCVVLAYLMHEAPSECADNLVGEPIALTRFNGCIAHIFGPPNDEAIAGHPLASRGLSPYDAFRVENSSWVRKLERMNSVHPSHRAERFKQYKHLIFVFHDSTFECVCKGFEFRLARGLFADTIREMAALLQTK